MKKQMWASLIYLFPAELSRTVEQSNKPDSSAKEPYCVTDHAFRQMKAIEQYFYVVLF